MSMLLALFQGSSLVTKAIAFLGLLAVLGTIYGVWHYKVYTRGYDAAIADIAANNKKVVARTRALRAKAVECDEKNGTWDVTNGTCN